VNPNPDEEVRLSKHRLGLLSTILFLCSVISSTPFFAQNTSVDLRAAAVEAFMAARTLEHNVEARKLMTANLEDDYLHNKRLSIRVRSGRVAAFNFDPARITQSGEKEFQAEVESVWADLNEQVFATQHERLKFIRVKNEWLADKIEFIESLPSKRLLPLNVESEKRGKLALAVIKKFMKAVVNRDTKMAVQYTTQEFQRKLKGQEGLEQFLAGPSDPRYAAYDVRRLTQTDPVTMEARVGLYLVHTGKRGFETVEVRLIVKEGKTDWNIDDFQIETPQRGVSS
jgi:hypothetical protein